MKEILPNKIFLYNQWLEREKINIKHWQFGSGNLTPDNWGVGTYVFSYESEHIFCYMNTYSKKCS